MSPNEIVGDRFFLRDFQESDIDDTYLGWLNDKNLMRFSNQRFMSHNLNTAQTYLKTMRQEGNLFLAVCEEISQKSLGTVSIYLNRVHGTANMGILIGDSQARGRGLGGKAWAASLDYLFCALGLRKVCAGTLDANVPMNKIAIGAGMRLEGVLFEQELIDGVPANLNLYGLFAPKA